MRRLLGFVGVALKISYASNGGKYFRATPSGLVGVYEPV